MRSSQAEAVQWGRAEAYRCTSCGHRTDARSASTGRVRGNTERFSATQFMLWQCSSCYAIHALEPIDFAEIYADYPLKERAFDFFARATLGNLLRRLRHAGLEKGHTLLDYGAAAGHFVRLLHDKGYEHARGWDPYVSEVAERPPEGMRFDWVVATDVIEHVPDPGAMLRDCAALLAPGGRLHIETAAAEGIDMDGLERHRFVLHQPFHRTIFTHEGLVNLAAEAGFELVLSYERPYLDTKIPFANYRFLDEFNATHSHVLERVIGPRAESPLAAFLRRPSLFFYGFLGYFLPRREGLAVVLRRSDKPAHSLAA